MAVVELIETKRLMIQNFSKWLIYLVVKRVSIVYVSMSKIFRLSFMKSLEKRDRSSKTASLTIDEAVMSLICRCHSWKFPDKIATDIDIAELLQRYQYGKHEVDNQVSHIVLFEVIIDRFVVRWLMSTGIFLSALQTSLSFTWLLALLERNAKSTSASHH